jgi:hypothetical protein
MVVVLHCKMRAYSVCAMQLYKPMNMRCNYVLQLVPSYFVASSSACYAEAPCHVQQQFL